MKKTTPYARKLRRRGITSGALEKKVVTAVAARSITHTIALHQPYDHPTNVPDADRILADVRMSLYKLANGQLTPADDWRHFYNLCDHIGAGQMRCMEIMGDDRTANHVMATLNAAGQALRRVHERHTRLGNWGLDGLGLIHLQSGVTAAETLMLASTPAQMRIAQQRYFDWRDTNTTRRAA
jgi:hypothetical protein